jgi:Domain of unknown function
LARIEEVAVPATATGSIDRAPLVPSHAPAFVRDVTARMMAGSGDDVPVSALQRLIEQKYRDCEEFAAVHGGPSPARVGALARKP